MTTGPDGAKRKNSIAAELILPAMAAAYATYYVLSVHDFPREAQMFGASIAVALWVLVVWFAIRVVREVAQGRSRWGDRSDLPSRRDMARRAGFIGLVVANVALIDHLGFGLTIFLFVLLSMLLLGVRNRRMLVLMPTAVALSGYMLFIVLLRAKLPAGPVESVLGWIF